MKGRLLELPPVTASNFLIVGKGFNADDGASLFMAFRGLQNESAAQGEVHMSVAKELGELVAEPFSQWAAGHKVRSELV